MSDQISEITVTEVAEVLANLRVKLMRIFIIIAIVWGISFATLSNVIIEKIKMDLLPEGAELIYQAPLEVMMLRLKISIILGVVVALPYIVYLTYQTLKERTELLSNIELTRARVIIYASLAAILFISGVAYGYVLMLPLFLQFLYESAQGQGVLAMYSISEFISFVVMMLAVFGLIFQMPLFMYVTVKNGLARLDTFKYYRRHFYIIFFTLAAIITPPDVFTQLMVGVPMVLFFEISLIIVKIFA
ncbi:twin-arginine translocase subunit TatC [Geoglobus acetivorans]|uniref:Sec-independent protein translocase protein TatC n=1 Tax=Geoglobus acetivorans TaxID=565033 RepID=A0ABZ3GZ86_GEOAI